MVTLFMDTLGFGLIIPVLPGLLSDLSGGTVAAAAWGVGGVRVLDRAVLLLARDRQPVGRLTAGPYCFCHWRRRVDA